MAIGKGRIMTAVMAGLLMGASSFLVDIVLARVAFLATLSDRAKTAVRFGTVFVMAGILGTVLR